MKKAQNFLSYVLALDESIDIRSAAKLAIFIRGVDDYFEITEELAAIAVIKGTTRNSDLLQGVVAIVKSLGLSLSKLSGITTDGAPSMVGRQQGLGNLLQPEASKVGNDFIMQFHCIIHQENLCLFIFHSSFEEVSTPDQTQTGLGPRVYPFTNPGYCTS